MEVQTENPIVEFNLDDNQIIDYIKHMFDLEPDQPVPWRKDIITDSFQSVLVDNVYCVLKYDLHIYRMYKKKYNTMRSIIESQTYNEYHMFYGMNSSFPDDIENNKFYIPTRTKPTFYKNTTGHRNKSIDYNSLEYQSLCYSKPDDYITKYNSMLKNCYNYITEYKLMYRQQHILYSLLRGVPLYKVDNTYKYSTYRTVATEPIDYILELLKSRICNISDPTYEI